MGINVKKRTTIFDVGSKMRFYLEAICENKRFPTIVAGAAIAGLTMIAGSLIVGAASGGLAAPLVMASLVIGSALLGGAVIAGLLYGTNKLVNYLSPKEESMPATAYPGF